MNQVLSLIDAAKHCPARRDSLHSDRMRSELVALHEDMVEQLRRERMSVGDKSDFLNALIEQHEQTAAILRTTLTAYYPDTSWHDAASQDQDQRPVEKLSR